MKTPTSPRRAREVRDHVHRMDDGNAFMPDPEGGEAHSDDTLAENLAEVFLESATSGEEQTEHMLNDLVYEEIGGPFLEDEPPDEMELELDPIPRPPRHAKKH
jgi:hypothetical protein